MSSSEASQDLIITQTRIKGKSKGKGKDKAGEKIEWSDVDEVDNVYETFKNRKSIKRKQNAAARRRKKLKSKADSEAEDEQEILEEMPAYWRDRRKQFDDQYQHLSEAGLKLPPRCSEDEVARDDRLATRPDFPDSIEPSRTFEDVLLPQSAGVIPAPIAQYLRDYQVEGVEFLHELFVYQKGGILGDDMGLGKTVQVAAMLTAAFGKTGDERDAKRMRLIRRSGAEWYPRVLIVCPSSLMLNWKQELERWGWWSLDLFHGDRPTREDVMSAASSGRLEVVITTYKTYSNHRSQVNLIEWDCVIADEMHVMKEGMAEVTRAMLEVNALCRIGEFACRLQARLISL